MVKRIFVLFMAFSLLASPFVAYADAIRINAFEWEHGEEMKSLGRRRFCAVGPDGYVTVREEPSWESEKFTYNNGEEIRYKNGTEIYMDKFYIDKGDLWGGMAQTHHGPDPG